LNELKLPNTTRNYFELYQRQFSGIHRHASRTRWERNAPDPHLAAASTTSNIRSKITI